jgi:hypothetical protein
VDGDSVGEETGEEVKVVCLYSSFVCFGVAV